MPKWRIWFGARGHAADPARLRLLRAGKRALERLAREFPLTVETRDLASEEGRALAERGGVMFPPGLFVEVSGSRMDAWSERELRRALRKRVQT